MIKRNQITKSFSVPQNGRTDDCGVAWEERISPYEYESLKSFLFALWQNRLLLPCVRVHRCLAHSSLSHRPQRPSTMATGAGRLPLVPDGVVEATAGWQEGEYELTVSKEAIFDGSRTHTIYCLGLNGAALLAKELVALCRREAQRASSLRNAVLRLVDDGTPQGGQSLQKVDLEERASPALYLAPQTHDAVELFVQAVHTYDRTRRPLRYMLSGRPGTGKTEIIRTIVDRCRGHATFVLVQGVADMCQAFAAAREFEPAVLCFDDLDLLVGHRSGHVSAPVLGEFLSGMEGIDSAATFVLATTNDKRWVDTAASRPGRFDMVLELDMLRYEEYAALVRDRCSRGDLRPLFGEAVLQRLVDWQVTGAFAVNLVKQVELRSALRPEPLTEEDVLVLMQWLRKGFSPSSQRGSDRAIGFGK